VSYPQPNANAYALGGSQFFRLNTLLSSPGDIYESEQSGLALAIGPNSDIAKVGVAYFDGQTPTYMNRMVIDPNRMFLGRLDARNAASTYAPSGRPGRILMWSEDAYDPSYVPSAAVGWGVSDTVTIIPPQLDVIEFFQQIPSPSRRADREYKIQHAGANFTGQTWLVFPCYGRKFGSISCTCGGNTPTFTLRVVGVRYSAPYVTSGGGVTTLGNPTTSETTIYSASLASGASKTVKDFLGGGVDTNAGMYDSIAVCVKYVADSHDGGNVPLRVYFSDEP
jgi:hypothetical protein